MSSRRTILFAIAGVLAVVVLITNFLPGGGAKPTPGPTLVPVVVAKHDIPPYTVLRIEDVRTAQVPSGKVEDVFGGLREVAGLMTTTEIRAGNAVERSNVLMPDSSWLKGDMLIFSFYVSTARVLGGQLRPGHHIDLLVTRAGTEELPAESLWLARNLWVVGVHQSSGEDVGRPTAAIYNPTPTQKGDKGTSTDLIPVNPERARQGASNLVVVAAHRETAQMIGDYLGAQLYDAWVYIRPGQLGTGGATAVPSGRIDGLVFVDQKNPAVHDRDEAGLDDVTVTLSGEATSLTFTTDSGGRFFFDQLAPSNYRVEVTMPEGYVNTTPMRLSLYVAEGQNHHILFGLTRPTSPTSPVPTPTEAAAGATSTPPKAEVTETPLPPGSVALHMSDRENGPALAEFGREVQEVWAVLEFKDFKDAACVVKAYFEGTGNQEHQVSSFTWTGGSGPKSVRVMPTDLTSSGKFEPGVYVSLVRVGPEGTVRDLKFWRVSGNATVTTPTPTGAIPPTGSDVERQR